MFKKKKKILVCWIIFFSQSIGRKNVKAFSAFIERICLLYAEKVDYGSHSSLRNVSPCNVIPSQDYILLYWFTHQETVTLCPYLLSASIFKLKLSIIFAYQNLAHVFSKKKKKIWLMFQYWPHNSNKIKIKLICKTAWPMALNYNRLPTNSRLIWFACSIQSCYPIIRCKGEREIDCEPHNIY